MSSSKRDEVIIVFEKIATQDNKYSTDIVNKHDDYLIATSEPLASATLTDIIEAYLVVYPPLRAKIPSAIVRGRDPAGIAVHHLNRLLIGALTSAAVEATSTDEMVAALLAHPEHARALARTVFRRAPKHQFTCRSASLGLLTKEIHELAEFTPTVTRAKYLELQARHVEPKLTTHEFELVRALCQEWEGTFPSLLETAQTMRPA
jgi:hypothetical protein